MANKHTISDLYQMQSLPLTAKIQMTKQRIKGWYEYWDGDVYVSVSGGKDSQVLAHIVKEIYPDVPLVFVNTGLEYDSVRLKGLELADEVLRPQMDFYNVLIKYGYPIISKDVAHKIGLMRRNPDGKVVKYFDGSQEGSLYDVQRYKWLIEAPFRIDAACCRVMKKDTAHRYNKSHNKKPFIGTMADESRFRKNAWLKNGCNAFETQQPSSQPLSFWTEQD